jgi:hypothetical protein
MKWFMQAQHWQIFLLVFAFPLALLSSGFILTNYYFNPAILFYLFPISIAVLQTSIYAWMWVVGTNLSKQNNRVTKSGLSLFRLFIIIPMVILGMILIFWLSGATFFSLGSFSMADVLYASLIVILPIQFLIVISMFYCYVFIAKTIKMAEEGRDLKFDEYFAEFIFVAILFIGIWVLQPRINKLASK